MAQEKFSKFFFVNQKKNFFFLERVETLPIEHFINETRFIHFEIYSELNKKHTQWTHQPPDNKVSRNYYDYVQAQDGAKIFSIVF